MSPDIRLCLRHVLRRPLTLSQAQLESSLKPARRLWGSVTSRPIDRPLPYSREDQISEANVKVNIKGKRKTLAKNAIIPIVPFDSLPWTQEARKVILQVLQRAQETKEE